MSVELYRNVIIGSGEGGKHLAWHLAHSGESTLVVERQWIGGSCPNVNCLPAKSEIWSARVAHLASHAEEFGTVTGPVTIDMDRVRQRKRDMVQGLIAMHLAKYQASGAELCMGSATFIAPSTLSIRLNTGGTRSIIGERIFVNIGSHATIPDIPGLYQASPLTHIEILELNVIPEHLIVIGGGYVGLEFAQAYRRFGSKVTVLQHATHLIPRHDPDVSNELEQVLVSEGINVITFADILKVAGRSGLAVELTVNTREGVRQLSGTHILVAAGRSPNSSGIGLERAGIQVTPQGWIRVNTRLETTALNVWAIGECAGSPQFTHASLDDFRIIRDNLAGGNRSTLDRLMPSCLFTDPPLAHIGLSERQATQKGIPVRVLRLPTASVLRTRTTNQSRGFMKALVSELDNKILGFTMIGPEAGEVMTVVQMAMLGNATTSTLRDAVIAHPTMAEGLNALFSI